MIYLTYFKNYKGDQCYNIGKFNSFYKGKSYKKLIPDRELLASWSKLSKTEQNDPKNIDSFIKTYREKTLNKLNPKEVYKELNGKTLLTGNKVCPIRKAVIMWFKENHLKAEEL